MNPVDSYLSRLSPGSLPAQRGACRLLAELIARPWAWLEPGDTAAVRATLAERYAPATANRHLAALRGVLRECWRMGLMDADRYQRCADVPDVRQSKLPTGRMLAPHELAHLLEAPCARDRAMVALMAGCGLRREETCALDVADVTGSSVTVRGGKGNKDRVVPMPPWVAGIVRSAMPDGDGPLLRNADGGRLSVGGINYLLGRLGVPCSPHDLRRTYCSNMLDVADVVTVQQLMGHASTTQTARYDRRPERQRAQAVEALEDPRNIPLDNVIPFGRVGA